MFKRWRSTAAVGTLVLLLSPAVSSAQRGGHGGGGHSGGHNAGHSAGHSVGHVGTAHVGGAHIGTVHVGGAHITTAHVGGVGGVRITGTNVYHNGGRGYSGGYYPGLYAYAPSYVSPSVYVVPPVTSYATPVVSNYYAPPAVVRSSAPLPEPPAQSTNTAMIDVKVPADAEIWFDGDKTSQTGSLRSFQTPSVQPGKSFTYDIRARWIAPDGQAVDLTRQVQFQAGQRITVDFLRP